MMITKKLFTTGVLAFSLTSSSMLLLSSTAFADPCATPEARRVLEERRNGARQMERDLDRELRKTVGSGDVTDTASQMMLSCSDEVNNLIDNLSGGGTFSSILRAFNLGSTVCNEINKVDDRLRGLTGYGVRDAAGSGLPPVLPTSSSSGTTTPISGVIGPTPISPTPSSVNTAPSTSVNDSRGSLDAIY